ncbi:substrate-binding domain-containing protein [Carnobacterium maltaromaticum]|uniref:substrate-binding domain-containing protein n=1 Tax=Carnobacterium maltaromaticum TaxID=2751 RepID=UPI00295E6844|nr:substrate-binding domain-containing protein [Carnobacterium maltaromaticum]
MSKVTMQDIAEHLAISKNSVSQALRNKNGVSQRTRELVHEAAEKLGYAYKEKNDEGRLNLKFLLVATEFALSQTSFFGEIVSSIKETVEKNGNHLVVEAIYPEQVEQLILPNVFKEEKWAGIFILSHLSNEYSQKLIESNVPCVLVDHHHPHLKTDAVLTQNNDGAFLAVDYLLGRGHKQIGFIGNVEFSPSYAERLIGYEKALESQGIIPNKEHIFCDIKEDQAQLFERLTRLKTMPTAWFCVNSGLAFILNTFLQSQGFEIPGDSAILCFDNTEFTRLAQPQISSIATDLDYMGEKAVAVMEQRILEPDSAYVQVSILPELVLRAST